MFPLFFHCGRNHKETSSNVSLLSTARQALANIDDLSTTHISNLKQTGNENDQIYKDLVSILTLSRKANDALALMKIEDDDNANDGNDKYDTGIMQNIDSKDFDQILNEIENDIEIQSNAPKTNNTTNNNNNNEYDSKDNNVTFGQLPVTTQRFITRPVL